MFFFLMIRRPPSFTQSRSSAASDVYKRQMINKGLNTTPAEALNGTSVLNTISLLNGADILRVHDVAQAREAVELVGFYNKCQNL